MKSKTYDFANRDYDELEQIVMEHVNRTDNPHQVTGADIGLGNVDNTSDMNKPVSTAQKKYIDSLTVCQIKMIRADEQEVTEEDYTIGEVKVSLLNNLGSVVSSDSFLVDKVAHDFKNNAFISDYAAHLNINTNGHLELVAHDDTILSEGDLPAGLKAVTFDTTNNNLKLVFHLYDDSTLECDLRALFTIFDDRYVSTDKLIEINARFEQDEATVAQLDTKVGVLHNELEEKIADNKVDIERKLKAVTDDITNFKSLNATQHQQLDAKIDSTKDNLLTEINKIDARVTVLDAKVDANKVELNAKIDTTKAELENKIATTEANIKTYVDGQDATLNTRITNEVATLNNSINNAKSELQGNINTTKSELNDSINDVRADLTTDVNNAIAECKQHTNTEVAHLEIEIGDVSEDIRDEMDATEKSLKRIIETVETNLKADLDKCGYSIQVEADTTNYIYTFKLCDKSGKALSTALIDLPIEDFVRSEQLTELDTRVTTTINQFKAELDAFKRDIPADIASLKSDVADIKEKYAKKNDLPTKTSELTNDSNFVADANYTHIDNNYTNADKAKVDAIPANPKYTDTIYDDTEIKGQITTLTSKVNNKQDKLIAGANIKIDANNSISADLSGVNPTMGRNFTTTIALGHLAAGSEIKSTDLIKDVLYKILYQATPGTSDKALFYIGSTIPSSIGSTGWTEQDVSGTITSTGITHDYVKSSASYIAFAYPKSYGNIAHIYANGLTIFDLIDNWTLSTTTYDGKDYNLYVLPSIDAKGTDSYQFKW